MPVLTALFLAASFALAVVIGPQTRPWSWGPAMAALGLAVLAALPAIWRRGRSPADLGTIVLGVLTAAWFGWRAWVSPVAELGQADLLLVAVAVGGFVSVRAIAGHPVAERILAWGIALLLLASLVVVAMQIQDPTFSPVFRERSGERMVTGFFAHYIEGANYLVASAMLVAAAALFGRHATATRVFFFLLAVASLVGVWFTRSRGGILGAAIAFGVFAMVSLILAKRRGAKWFAPALIAIPLIGIGIGAFLFLGWQEAQDLRHAGTSIEDLMDNNSRLYLLGIALSCTALHPLTGGGARSYSWECFRFADGKAHGDIITHRPDMVHNELAQAAADYGLTGVGLLVVLFGTLAVLVVIRTLFEETRGSDGRRDAWRAGGLATFAGLLAQSNFSFIFHLMPGVLLLGMSLGQMSRSPGQSGGIRPPVIRALLTAAALFAALLLLPAGWRGTRVTLAMWPSYFSKQPELGLESRIDALTRALRFWPLSDFHEERAELHQLQAQSGQSASFNDTMEMAVADYQEAAALHPYDPSPQVNLANVLSSMERDSDAEAAYARAIALQGGMEPAYRAQFSLSGHFHRKGLRLFEADDREGSLEAMELAAKHIELAASQMHWVLRDMVEPRISIHESLGTAREAAGDREGALQSYDFAASLQGGKRAHYRAGVLIGKAAVDAWYKRIPGEALRDFIEARRRIGLAGDELPEGVTPSQKIEYTDYLDRNIAFLKGAKVEPTK